jgi:hypothetical protein
MYTKLSMIEETLKRKKENGGVNTTLPVIAGDKETNALIDDLRKRYVYFVCGFGFQFQMEASLSEGGPVSLSCLTRPPLPFKM